MNDSQLLALALAAAVAVYIYHHWNTRTPRRTTIMRTVGRPVRHDPATGCYEPFCPGDFRAATEGAPGDVRVRDQKRVREYYHNRVDLEHMRAHTSPLYSGDVAGSAPAAVALVEREVNASSNPGTTMAPLVYMRDDAYAAPASVHPGMLCRES